MPRVTNETLMDQADLDAGTTAAVAACQAAYPDGTPIRAYKDATTLGFVVTMGFRAADGVVSPLNVVTDASAVILYHEPRPNTEPYSEVVSRVEEAVLPQRRRPPTGALVLTGLAATRTP